ncbi:MAG: hypothetical protein AseanaTS_06940 [Candidatus Pelagadaptatus aseana]|uniref:TetR/AcrR family transcriptional regulator n=1 Tax=Candidatus Pelagadaptatus aseana TaxID=3120508 RepID=UPI0039B25564
MKPLPTQKRALEKRAALVNAAQISFAENGYEATTAKTIAAKAEVATGTFYQYFDNKDDMLRVIAQKKRDEIYQAMPELAARVIETAAPSTEDLFRDVLELIYSYHEAEAELHQVLEQRRVNDPELDAILLRSEDIMEDKVRQFVKTFNKDNPEAVAYNLFAMAEGLVHRHVFGNPDTGKQETLDLGARMLACYFDCQH